MLCLTFAVTMLPTAASAATFSQVTVTPQNPIADYAATQSYAVDVRGASGATARCIRAHFVYSSLSLPQPASAHWQYSGGATATSSSITLTTPSQHFAGTAGVYDVALPVDGVHATFDGYMGDGSGADGMTFVLLDSTAWGGYAGTGGGGLGYSGLSGVAVTMDTSQNDSDPSSNFIGIATSGSGSAITYAATSTSVPSLRSTTHHYDITATSTNVAVSIDGVQYLNQAVSLPSSVYAGFTAGTGGGSDLHRITNIAITSTSVGPTGTASMKPANMGSSGPTLAGSSAVDPANWAVSSGAADRLEWTYGAGEAMHDGTLVMTNITRNPAIAGTYYVRVETFANTGCTTPIDSGYGTFVIQSGEATTEVGVTVDPSLSFSLAGYNAGACNGPAVTATGSSATSVDLGHPTASANAVGGQSVTVSSNANGGYSVFLRSTDRLRNGSGRAYADHAGSNAAPSAFSAAGVESVGYTTDHALAGSPTRFQSDKWAALSTSDEEVAYMSSSSTTTAHVCYQVGVASSTPAGRYQATIVYTVVPNF